MNEFLENKESKILISSNEELELIKNELNKEKDLIHRILHVNDTPTHQLNRREMYLTLNDIDILLNKIDSEIY